MTGLDLGRGSAVSLSRKLWQCAPSTNALTAPILILGAPRSGTTWLAKIIDSHPDVLYRHEPDAILPGPRALSPVALPALLAGWAANTSARATTKRPYFQKSWQPGWARRLRTLIAGAISAAAPLPPPFKSLAACRIPDLGARAAPRLVIKSIAWAEGASVLSATLPNSRTIFLMRHPCGQVASVMRGNRDHRFDLKTKGTDMPFDEDRAIRFARAFGVEDTQFQALPDASKYAWSWRAFNEPTYAALADRPNVHVVIYEGLCAEPQSLARQILGFAGLDWDRQTEDFVRRSTAHHGEAGYYAIYRNAVAAADGWRSTMAPDDQDAVRGVARLSPLAHFWPDLIAAP